MLKHSKMNALLLIGSIILGTPALAKKSRREGFNFGSGVKILSADDRTLGGGETDKTIHSTKSTEAFSPYVAISSGTFNLGLKADLDKTAINDTEVDRSNNTESIRIREITTNSGSLFARFLFGEILFLEGGLGLYQERQHIKNTFTSAAGDGNFQGALEEYRIDGSGPGYHLGAGFEIATGGGFFFNGAYLTKIYRINAGEAVFGKINERAYEQKREVCFGLAYYAD